MIKKFLEWIGLKEKLHSNSDKFVYFNEGEVWWCALGENIGVEINGKGTMFSRPVLIYKKLSKSGFLAVPLSTQIKEGSWYISVEFKEKTISANLAQLRIVSTARLYDKMGEVTAEDFSKVKSGFLRLYS